MTCILGRSFKILSRHTHTGKTDYSVAGEGVTKRAASGPFGTFCHHVVTKRSGETKRAGSASNLTRFVTLVKTCRNRPLDFGMDSVLQ